MPELASEVRELAERSGDPGLAEQVSSLRIVDRCRCGDQFCATVYTEQPPHEGWGPRHRNVDLDAEAGCMILDLVDGRIVSVEILNRDDIRSRLLQVVP